MEKLAEYFGAVMRTWFELAPWLLIGLLVAGMIYVFFPTHKLKRLTAGKGVWAVFKVALIGIPIPLCSCGVIPTALTLRKRGCSKGATTAFLISTPETGVDSIALTWAIMDPVMTVCRPLAAFVTAIFCGILQDIPKDDMKGVDVVVDEEQCHLCLLPALDGHGHGWNEKIAKIFSFGFGEMLMDIGKWLMIGVLLAGLLQMFLAPEFVQQYLGQGVAPMLLMLVIGIPLYICASASTPIAAALVVAGVSPGAALVLLLVGPATNIATLGVLWKFLGKRATFIYVISLAVVSLGFGFGLDYVYTEILQRPPDFRYSASSAAESGLWHWFEYATGIILLVTFAVLLVKKRLRKNSGTDGSSCCADTGCSA